MTTIRFKVSEFESKIRNLESNGFEEYLSTHNDNIDHVIMTNTKVGHRYNGWVVDIYSNGRIEYSNQFKS
jgi:hypothetical protein